MKKRNNGRSLKYSHFFAYSLFHQMNYHTYYHLHLNELEQHSHSHQLQ